MNRLSSTGLLALSLATLATGCGARMFFPAVLAADVAVTGAVIASREPRPVVVVEASPPPDAIMMSTQPMAAGFPDAASIRTAIESVDVATCWEPGSTHGAGTARVTFKPSGDVGMIEIQNPVEGARADTDCLTRRYGSLRLPPFVGNPIAVSGMMVVG